MKEEVHLIPDQEEDFDYQKIRRQEYRQSAAGRWPLLNEIDLYFAALQRSKIRSDEGFKESADSTNGPQPKTPQNVGTPETQSHNSKIRFVRWPS
jgi:hypothetical protein